MLHKYRTPILAKIALIFLAILSSQGSFAGTHRFKIVLATPVRPHYSQEEMLQTDLASRISVDFTHITWSEQKKDQAALVEKIRSLKPDLIYTWGTVTTTAVAGTYDKFDSQANITDIPIVFFTVAYPDQTKLVKTMKRPGRNITGVTHVVPVSEQFDILMRWSVAGKIKIGTIYNNAEPNSLAALEEVKKWCKEHDAELFPEPLALAWDKNKDVRTIQDAVKRLAEEKITWLYIGADKMLGLTYADELTDAALKMQVPTFSGIDTPVRKAKALWGLYTPIEPAVLKAGDMIVAILNGSILAGDTPVAVPRQNIVINQDVMMALGLYPPTNLRKMANVVYSTVPRQK